MQPRTKKQKDVLEFIKHYIDKHGYEPSYQQIARQLGVKSKAGIAKHIEALENQGLLKRSRESGSFKLEINTTSSILESVIEVPWIKSVDAKDRTLEFEDSPLFVPAILAEGFSREKLSAFRVPDESMTGVHICEGDIALIENRPYPRDGEIVVALIDEESVILHKFYRSGANIELRPANQDFEARLLAADDVEIIGVLRGILRPMG